MDQALDVAAALNVTQIVIYSPYSTWMRNNLDNWPEQRQRVLELTHATLDAAVKRAESQGCVFVLENIEDKDPADRRTLVESFNSSAFALSIDTGHAAYACGSTGPRRSTSSSSTPGRHCHTFICRMPTAMPTATGRWAMAMSTGAPSSPASPTSRPTRA
jgi:hypothetical protein